MSYTIGMKTAISLPDKLFREAELHARRAGKSRSQLYADALAEYLHRHAPDTVTESMNRVVELMGESMADPFARESGRRLIERVEW